jgi:hypothetical protein
MSLDSFDLEDRAADFWINYIISWRSSAKEEGTPPARIVEQANMFVDEFMKKFSDQKKKEKAKVINIRSAKDKKDE